MEEWHFEQIQTRPTNLTSSLRKDLTSNPLILKYLPNVTDITVIARAAQDGGADAVYMH
jgi:dihydroorotate dehydrogenase (NAD+) catalytic subunit